MDETTTEILKSTVAGLIRHGLTVAAGSLVTLGLLQSNDSANFVSIGSGLALGAVGIVWSWWQKKGQQQVIDELKAYRR
jgi:hypothetical protein